MGHHANGAPFCVTPPPSRADGVMDVQSPSGAHILRDEPCGPLEPPLNLWGLQAPPPPGGGFQLSTSLGNPSLTPCHVHPSAVRRTIDEARRTSTPSPSPSVGRRTGLEWRISRSSPARHDGAAGDGGHDGRRGCGREAVSEGRAHGASLGVWEMRDGVVRATWPRQSQNAEGVTQSPGRTYCVSGPNHYTHTHTK